MLWKGCPVEQIEPRRWGVWELNVDSACLDAHGEDASCFHLDLLTAGSSAAELVNAIFGVRGLPWASEQVVSDLLAALDDVLSPLVWLCGMGPGSEMSVGDTVKLIEGAARRR